MARKNTPSTKAQKKKHCMFQFQQLKGMFKHIQSLERLKFQMIHTKRFEILLKNITVSWLLSKKFNLIFIQTKKTRCQVCKKKARSSFVGLFWFLQSFLLI